MRAGIAGLTACLILPGIVTFGGTPAATTNSALVQVRSYIAAKVSEGAIRKADAKWRTKLPVFPEISYPADFTYIVELKTGKGDMRIRLLPETAPRHVANLMYLVELGFYDGELFQYIVPGERAQWGCPIGDGRGTPGYTFDVETAAELRHNKAGLLSTANAGRKTDGCQFFLTLGPMPWMDGKRTIFGEVTDGLTTLDAIGKAGSPMGKPREDVAIQKATVLEIRRSTQP